MLFTSPAVKLPGVIEQTSLRITEALFRAWPRETKLCVEREVCSYRSFQPTGSRELGSRTAGPHPPKGPIPIIWVMGSELEPRKNNKQHNDKKKKTKKKKVDLFSELQRLGFKQLSELKRNFEGTHPDEEGSEHDKKAAPSLGERQSVDVGGCAKGAAL